MFNTPLKYLILTSALVTAPVGAAVALTITPESDSSVLADALFLNLPGLAITGTSISYADPSQFGTYHNAEGTYGLPLNGIVMSTGDARNYGSNGWGGGSGDIPVPVAMSGEIPGDDMPGDEEDTSGGWDRPATPEQTALLAPISGQEEFFDVAQLDITFIAAPDVTSVTFFATFGSQEWPDFVGSEFIDAFGLYVNGVNVAGAVQTGAAEGTAPLAININHPDMRSPDDIDLGSTGLSGILAPNNVPVLRFDVPVLAGQSNQFQMIVGDAGDDIYDTTVYLSSFVPTPGSVVAPGLGASEMDPILPSNPPDPVTGTFIIELPEVDENVIVWIDPPVAVGYEYELSAGVFTGIALPSLATVADIDGYTLTIGSQSFHVVAGEVVQFSDLLGAGAALPSSFVISDINPLLELDPTDGAAFPLGVMVSGTGFGATISMTPITIDVAPIPLPAAAPMLAAGFAMMGGMAALRRRRKAA